MANKFNFKPIERKARGAMESALVLIGNEAKNHFVSNFKKGGFEDKTVTPWVPRKKQDKRAGRAILVKSGDLRRSIIRGLISKSQLSVTIKTDLKYAKIHNDGGMTGRNRRGIMPKRQFIGGSYNLNEKVKKVLIAKLDSVFK